MKRTVTHGCVLKAGCIEAQSIRTNCGVSTGSVAKESIHSHGCIFAPGIVSESKRADRGVEATVRVEIQGERSVGRIFGAGSVGQERSCEPARRVEACRCVLLKREKCSNSGVVNASRVA